MQNARNDFSNSSTVGSPIDLKFGECPNGVIPQLFTHLDFAISAQKALFTKRAITWSRMGGLA